MRRQHRRVHVVGPRWAFGLAPLMLVASWAGAFALGRAGVTAPHPPLRGVEASDTAASRTKPRTGNEVPVLPSARETTLGTSTISTATRTRSAGSSEPSASTTVPEALEPEAPADGWGVQVGAFESEAEALQWLRVHRPEGPAFLSEVDLAERGIWYRLRLGRHASRRQARRAARHWAERLQDSPLVVEYP